MGHPNTIKLHKIQIVNIQFCFIQSASLEPSTPDVCYIKVDIKLDWITRSQKLASDCKDQSRCTDGRIKPGVRMT